MSARKNIRDKLVEVLEKTCKGNSLLFRKRNDNSEISHHLLQNGQSFGKLGDVTDILYFDRKLLYLDRFHVHKGQERATS